MQDDGQSDMPRKEERKKEKGKRLVEMSTL